jgi:hypothetical protein
MSMLILLMPRERVMEITGDTMNHQNVSLIAQANIIVTTVSKESFSRVEILL